MHTYIHAAAAHMPPPDSALRPPGRGCLGASCVASPPQIHNTICSNYIFI